MSWFNWLSGSAPTELPDIYPIPVAEKDFVSIDVINIYSRILTDVFERTSGIPEEAKNLLWDNCLASEKQDGLITLIAKAMVDKQDLFLVYRRDLKVIVKADPTEEAQIRADYKAKGESAAGVFITFKNYRKTDMVKFYSQLEYCSVGGLWKQGNLSKAVQFKFTDMRSSTGLADKEDVKVQAQALAKGLAAGKDIAIDAKDVVETLKPDLTATQSSIEFIAQKRAFYLGLPASYLTGELPGGLGDSGQGDMRATERGLKGYYFSIGKPVAEGLFKVKTTFKSDDAENLSTALETLKTMDLTSNDYLSHDNKTKVVNKAFGFDENEKGDEPVKPDPAQQVPPPAVPPANPPPPKQAAPPPQG